MTRAGGALAALTLVAAVALAGCGISPQGSPVPIPAGQGLGPEPSSTTSTTLPPKNQAKVQLYQVAASGRLGVLLAPIDEPVTLDSVLTALVQSGADVGSGCGSPTTTTAPTSRSRTTSTTSSAAFCYTSDIPSGTEVLSTVISAHGVATVNLSADIEGATNPALALAFAQVVFTATSPWWIHAHPATPVTSVLFEVEGSAVLTPLPNGAFVPGPVTQEQYAAVKPQ